MKREKGYGKILAVLIAAWIIYRCYEFVAGNREKKISNLSSWNGVRLEDFQVRKMNKKEIRERLGRATWTLLHTMGSRYPASPSFQQKKDTLSFIHLLSSLFPCGECTKHFQKLIQDHPPRVGSGKEFKTWLCEVHNIVNERLGKTIVDCRTVDEIWQCGCEA
ncbi:mitochondrial sulfhydryl oxidase [Encephalitozoon intestinalis ATCC 50506]|uniref:Sulfhydryl oxidase n=1 Tax=Encephalitozoon intestinalis (strain ATCC 50506) TaxID=876142 RepID=E0S7N0_ENCIT|nr:mitochondrial sulfhydryl oxidase [Encephalitozoon intestinalis ATCC 50506]ADM11709.1 mitochondrial sulfhydryl oxidase [Encephalitozoon intestinalis ATCC 50506]UTX45446.1 FAD-linked sulfhydryl oxidase Alr [Encephalitozoon intestinalis]